MPNQPPSLSQKIQDLSKRQADLTEQTKHLATLSDPDANKKAIQKLQDATQKLANTLADDKDAIPNSAKEALKDAKNDLHNAQAEANANHPDKAKEKTDKALQSLTKAESALEMAKNGLPPGSDPSKPSSPSASADDQSKMTPGDDKNGMKANEDVPSKGKSSNRTDASEGSGAGGDRANAHGSSAFLGLPERDRDVLRNSQSDKYPEEYGPMIEQYLKNLSDQSGGK